MYRVNHIFYSLQGEGRNTGRAAVFVRFAGCNLRCPFCDTEFSIYSEMSAETLLAAIFSAVGGFAADTPPLIVLTGGEPTLQADEALIALLHHHGYEVAMESNGTRPAPDNLDWLTVSPKDWWHPSGEWWRENPHRINELKIVFDEDTPARLSSLPLPPAALLYLQPCDTGDAARNAAIVHQCVDYIKRHPRWRLSLQTHKLIGIE